MELKNFIRESLHQICQGIQEAKGLTDGESSSQFEDDKPIAPKFSNQIQAINFDIAVTVTDDEKLNATGGINLKIVKGGADKQSSSKTENTHRISFSIPFYPKTLKAKGVKQEVV
jgi:hypothetical protein